MAWHPNGRARVSMRRPAAKAVCDDCGFMFSLSALRPKQQWAGNALVTYNYLVCKTCWDVPNQQLRSIALPPDPMPVFNPRPEQYDTIVPSFIATESASFAGNDLTTEAGDNLVWEIQDTPSPDPTNPAIYP